MTESTLLVEPWWVEMILTYLFTFLLCRHMARHNP